MTKMKIGGFRLESDTLGLAALLLGVFLLFAALRPAQFLSGLNVQSIGFAIPEIGLLALAMTVAMASGGIDLSVVGIANLSSITIALVSAKLAGGNDSVTTIVAVLAAITVGALAGLVNGVLVAFFRIRPILATLATGQLYLGLGIAITGGKALYTLPEPIQNLGLVTFASIPISVFLFAGAAATVWFVMSRTGFGLRALLFGANDNAAAFSGFNIPRIHLQTYVFIGALCGFAGILIAGRAASASASFGGSYMLLAITIAVLGGTDPMGGKIRIGGVLLATVLLQIVSNGFNLLQISPYIYQIVQGLILAVFIVTSINRTEFRAWWGKFKKPKETA